jgi:hypothetical protein
VPLRRSVSPVERRYRFLGVTLLVTLGYPPPALSCLSLGVYGECALVVSGVLETAYGGCIFPSGLCGGYIYIYFFSEGVPGGSRAHKCAYSGRRAHI